MQKQLYLTKVMLFILVVLSACSLELLTTQTVPTSSANPTFFSPTETSTGVPPTPTNWVYQNSIRIQIPIVNTAGKSTVEIVEYLFRRYMDQYKEDTIREGERLIDYEIVQIKILNDRYSSNFERTHKADYLAIADIIFSVKPVRMVYTDWAAGNGTYLKDEGWIRKKSVYYAVIVSDGYYILVGIGSSL